MISFKELKEKIEEYGYYATNELLYDCYNAILLFNNNERNPGQDIYAICLEGPPGAGKTEFAKTYQKITNDIYKDVELVDYQCDATTGKTELFEDINISAAIRGDADNVNIPGKLIEAIKKVNSGKRVVLFIDEYDKAREETDAFLLQFLQSGKINSTQHGDLEVKEEYKSNLQVIICKNDMREELSGPLSRRIRYIRLDYMKPKTFYEVATRLLIKEKRNPVSSELINLVSLLYDSSYKNKDLFNRLPSCSEMLIAIEDADRLIKNANAPQNIVYGTIIKNMFKSLDDISTLESVISKDEKVSSLINELKKEEDTKEGDINNKIAKNILSEYRKKLTDKVQELEELIKTYKEKFEKLEEEKQKTIEEEKNRIKILNGELVPSENEMKPISIFDDESLNIRRGHDIFEISKNNWTEIASVSKKGLSNKFFMDSIIPYLNDLDIKLYENGIIIRDDNEQKLIAIRDSIKPEEYKILSNYPIIPSTYLKDISAFIDLMIEVYNNEPRPPFADKNEEGYIHLNALIYNNAMIDSGQKSNEHIYNIKVDKEKIASNQDLKTYKTLFGKYYLSSLSSEEEEKAVSESIKLIKENKVKK